MLEQYSKSNIGSFKIWFLNWQQSSRLSCMKWISIQCVISPSSPMFESLLESSQWDDSNKLSNIGLSKGIGIIEMKTCTLSGALWQVHKLAPPDSTAIRNNYRWYTSITDYIPLSPNLPIFRSSKNIFPLKYTNQYSFSFVFRKTNKNQLESVWIILVSFLYNPPPPKKRLIRGLKSIRKYIFFRFFLPLITSYPL